MQKIVFIIKQLNEVACLTYRLELSCGYKLDIHSGEFVDIALSGKYLRRPIAVADVTDDGIILYFKVVGEGTLQLSQMFVGQSLELLVGLGKGFTVSACQSEALLVAGGLGAAPLFLLAKELLAANKRVNILLGFNTSEEIVLLSDYHSLGLKPQIVTMDGSFGLKGYVSDYLSDYQYDYFYTCGPLPMMKAVCKNTITSGECSLEERMGCGAGFCYACTCRTMLGAKRICKDGPVFQKEEIIWD